jgi:hypothetical protein
MKLTCEYYQNTSTVGESFSARQKAELPVLARSVIQMYASIHLSDSHSLDSGGIIQT